jgi:hypothetical protein
MTKLGQRSKAGNGRGNGYFQDNVIAENLQ